MIRDQGKLPKSDKCGSAMPHNKTGHENLFRTTSDKEEQEYNIDTSSSVKISQMYIH